MLDERGMREMRQQAIELLVIVGGAALIWFVPEPLGTPLFTAWVVTGVLYLSVAAVRGIRRKPHE